MSYIDSLKTRISNAIVESVARTIVEETTPSLTLQMKKIMADNFVFYFKAHSAHWNVEGDEFPMYHDFFSKIYEEAQGNVDTIAEQLRALGVYAPVSLREIMLDTTLAEFGEVKDADGMLTDLGADVQKIIGSLMAGQKLAEDAGETGLANFLQDLIDKNKKTAWMIKSTLKEGIESIDDELNEELSDSFYKKTNKLGDKIDASLKDTDKMKHHISKAPTKHLQFLQHFNMGYSGGGGYEHPAIPHIHAELKKRGKKPVDEVEGDRLFNEELSEETYKIIRKGSTFTSKGFSGDTVLSKHKSLEQAKKAFNRVSGHATLISPKGEKLDHKLV